MDDVFFIKRTLLLAERARGKTSPNPMVGALLVKNGRILSEGYHKKAGTPHAEVIAIDKAGEKASGATLYVSLEPCCHKDKRTPPCTEKIIVSGIRKVVIAMKDPNPKVSGKGVAELEKAGIQVIPGILEEKAKKLNEAYIRHITTGMPFAVLKVAMTLDGKIATPAGESKWITGEKARKLVHRVRGSVDAVMTAIGTVKADNPMLTCRVSGYKNPVRVVIDPNLETMPDSHVTACPPETVIVTRSANGKEPLSNMLREKGVSFIEYQSEQLDLKWLMQELGKSGITSLLIEGGSSLSSYCLEAGIVDKVMFFIAPKIIGGRDSFPAVGGNSFRQLENAHRLMDVKTKKIGEDILIEGYIQK
ncbi:MAG: bifunctional diaminohydroxyphosphoribosylaminopyrimidine deaminase/5-amino-6-(5-phosphoribosylamino)uracil reductase RibD [Nitrospirota bacterium]|nr:bifunctional diaminohydroxyphosphoribosylaminopyrimidine deaminase/5-amino-6-(5-phosphoribosylamino)uracil reductase RibD [Nitrospirota bacterium]